VTILNDEIYRQFLDCENVLWPRLREIMSRAVDDGDKKTVKRVHSRMARILRDVMEASDES
jgi:hypothetical protein